MPFIHLEMLEGRTLEQKQNLVKEMTDVISKHTNAPKENIHIIITELKKGTEYAQGGQFK